MLMITGLLKYVWPLLPSNLKELKGALEIFNE